MATIILRYGATGATGVKNAPLTVTEVDDNFKNLNNFKVEKTSDSGSAILPVGPNGASGALGYIRYNTDINKFQGYSNTGWGEIGSGATGPQGVQGSTGLTGSTGPTGATGQGASVTISDDTSTDISYYPTLAGSTGPLSQSYISTTKLYFNPSTGTLNATIYNSLSDITVKTDIETVHNAIDTVNQLHGVSFKWKETGIKSYGLIAQELEQVIPELVDGQELKSVNYSGLIAFLINSIKELDARVKELESK